MDKLRNFSKKYLSFLLIFTTIAACFALWLLDNLSKGTYSLNENDYVSITCPANASPGEEVNCDIKLLANNYNLLSVKANYNLPSGVNYVSFTIDETCSSENCYEITESTENGFAVGNTNGINNDTTIGQLKIKIPETAENDDKFNIELINIELSDDQDEMIDANDTISEITIIKTNEENDDSLFDESLTIDEDKNLIYRIQLGTTYSAFKAQTNPNATVNITSGDEEVEDSDIVKTGDVLTITLNDNTKTYTLSVLGDLTKDGEIDMGDVGMLYRHYKERIVITEEAVKIAGNTYNDDKLDMGDVGKLYRYFKGRITYEEVMR